MALSWLDRKRQDSGEWTGFLEQGVRLEGKLESAGTFRIDCAMKGTLVSEDTLILGEHASDRRPNYRELCRDCGTIRRSDSSARQSGNSAQGHRHR